MAQPSSASRSQRWAQHLADFDRSGLTVTQFCDSFGCSVPTFYNWKRKLGKAPVQPAFLRVQSVDAVDSAIEIKLPNGVLLPSPRHVRLLGVDPKSIHPGLPGGSNS